MKLKNLRLTLANIARTTNSRTLEAIETGTIKARNASGNWTDEVIGYTIECATYRGDTIKVKFPVDVETKIEALKRELEDDKTVMVGFTGLKLTAYALKAQDGSIISGISAKAEDFEIESISADDLIVDDENL